MVKPNQASRIVSLLPISQLLALGASMLGVLTHGVALSLRFEGETPPTEQLMFRAMLLAILLLRWLGFLIFRPFDGLWKYTSAVDAKNLFLGIMVSTPPIFVLTRWASSGVYPRSVVIIDALLLFVVLAAARISPRAYRELSRPQRHRRVLIFGAGDAGEMLVRDMLSNTDYDAEPIGFVDDDPRKKSRLIHGVPVLGSREMLDQIIAQTKPHEIIIAVPSAANATIRAIVRAMQQHSIKISTLPKLANLVGTPVETGLVRRLKLEDILGRESVELKPERLSTVFSGKCVLVTGAGGSIGSELCRQLAAQSPRTLVLLDRYENSLHETFEALRATAHNIEMHAVIADITDEGRINAVIANHRPGVIFHAGAHKHVPLMEHNPCEAVKNNIRGTRIVAEAAARNQVDRFILISTDKAVNPTSVMGASKRLAEMLVRAMARSSATNFVSVRFGNVLGSNGSVIPRFIAQIDAGGPVTITHPEMRRYFMLIPEAVQLVLHAAAMRDRNATYVLEMGEQIRVVDMARDLIRLSGYIPDSEIEIKFTGIRPGEKLSEELLAAGEVAEPSDVSKILKVQSPSEMATEVRNHVRLLEDLASRGRDQDVIEYFHSMFPSCSSQAQAQPINSH